MKDYKKMTFDELNKEYELECQILLDLILAESPKQIIKRQERLTNKIYLLLSKM